MCTPQRAYILVVYVSVASQRQHTLTLLVTNQDVYAIASLHTGRVCVSRIIATAYCDSIVIHLIIRF